MLMMKYSYVLAGENQQKNRQTRESKTNNDSADFSENVGPLSWDIQRRKVVFFLSCGVERRKSIYKSTKIFYH